MILTRAMAVDRIRGTDVPKVASGVQTFNATANGINKPAWQLFTQNQSPVNNNSNVECRMLN